MQQLKYKSAIIFPFVLFTLVLTCNRLYARFIYPEESSTLTSHSCITFLKMRLPKTCSWFSCCSCSSADATPWGQALDPPPWVRLVSALFPSLPSGRPNKASVLQWFLKKAINRGLNTLFLAFFTKIKEKKKKRKQLSSSSSALVTVWLDGQDLTQQHF